MKDQCVCISGSTHGIGYGMAEAFAKKGARIIINSHLDDNGALEKLSKLTECHFVKSDLSTVAGAEYLVNKSFELLGSLDTLINKKLLAASAIFKHVRNPRLDFGGWGHGNKSV